MSWLLIPLAALLCWREWRLAGPDVPPAIGRRRRARLFYDLCGLVALALLLQPLAPYRTAPEQERHLALAIVIDVSPSMGLSAPGTPSRLDLARAEISGLLQHLSGAQVALIPFAGKPVLQVPLTNDRQALHFFLRSLEPGLVNAPGSAPEEALALAAQVLSAAPGDKAILLFSDGERTLPGQGPPPEPGIPVYSILPGDRQPHPVPGRDAALSTPDLGRLQRLSLASGGEFLAATAGRLATAPLAQRWAARPDPVSPFLDQPLLLATFILLLARVALPLATGRRTGQLLLLLALAACSTSDREEAAEDLFQRALQVQDPGVAAELFEAAAERLEGPASLAARINACGSLLAAGRPGAAVATCELALLEVPGHPAAAANLSLALRSLNTPPQVEASGQGSRPRVDHRKGQGMTANEAREVMRSANILPFSKAEMTGQDSKSVELHVERDW